MIMVYDCETPDGMAKLSRASITVDGFKLWLSNFLFLFKHDFLHLSFNAKACKYSSFPIVSKLHNTPRSQNNVESTRQFNSILELTLLSCVNISLWQRKLFLFVSWKLHNLSCFCKNVYNDFCFFGKRWHICTQFHILMGNIFNSNVNVSVTERKQTRKKLPRFSSKALAEGFLLLTVS